MNILLCVQIVGVYLAVGLLFGLAFVLLGLTKLDPTARGSSWAFRLVLLPGLAALWPIMALRWMRGGDGETAA